MAAKEDATRRSFFRFLFGAAAAAPVLPEVAKALAAEAPIGPAQTVRTGLPAGVWRKFYDGVPEAQAKLNASQSRYLRLERLREMAIREYADDLCYHGVPIREVESLKS
jgi:hypothetical protein